MRSEATGSFHTTDAGSARDLRDAETLTRDDGRAVEAIRLLELPHARAWIAAVALGRDRPQRLARLHAMDVWRRPRAGVPREHGPDEHCDEHYKDDPTEHVFAL